MNAKRKKNPLILSSRIGKEIGCEEYPKVKLTEQIFIDSLCGDNDELIFKKERKKKLTYGLGA